MSQVHPCTDKPEHRSLVSLVISALTHSSANAVAVAFAVCASVDDLPSGSVALTFNLKRRKDRSQLIYLSQSERIPLRCAG